jgi:cell shape-determining protein MreC
MKYHTLSGHFKIDILNKDLPVWQCSTNLKGNSHTENWSTKVLGCQINQLWYNIQIETDKGSNYGIQH